MHSQSRLSKRTISFTPRPLDAEEKSPLPHTLPKKTRVNAEVLEERKISCPYQESKHDYGCSASSLVGKNLMQAILKRKRIFIYKITVTVQIRRDACCLLCRLSLGVFTMSVCGSASTTQDPITNFHKVLYFKFSLASGSTCQLWLISEDTMGID
jgi:hypothetical protein